MRDEKRSELSKVYLPQSVPDLESDYLDLTDVCDGELPDSCTVPEQYQE